MEALYLELGGTGTDYDVQILSTTKSSFGGSTGLNLILHDWFHASSQRVRSFNYEFKEVDASTNECIALCVGDLVMYTENDYTLGLRNGSLGKITAALKPEFPESPCCAAEFDGITYNLTTAHLRAVTHAYAITVHKSQGSQFKRVIVPIRSSKLLDQALLYTAVTRGIEQVVFVGDKRTAERIITNPPSAAKRTTALPGMLVKIER